ncbi:unnamed protein product [Amoebophrya sp. A25]|nr:unnamed protein product [Amoebophrya sp. A25]|eukprot:GSA25T00015398001.1
MACSSDVLGHARPAPADRKKHLARTFYLAIGGKSGLLCMARINTVEREVDEETDNEDTRERATNEGGGNYDDADLQGTADSAIDEDSEDNAASLVPSSSISSLEDANGLPDVDEEAALSSCKTSAGAKVPGSSSCGRKKETRFRRRKKVVTELVVSPDIVRFPGHERTITKVQFLDGRGMLDQADKGFPKRGDAFPEFEHLRLLSVATDRQILIWDCGRAECLLAHWDPAMVMGTAILLPATAHSTYLMYATSLQKLQVVDASSAGSPVTERAPPGSETCPKNARCLQAVDEIATEEYETWCLCYDGRKAVVAGTKNGCLRVLDIVEGGGRGERKTSFVIRNTMRLPIVGSGRGAPVTWMTLVRKGNGALFVVSLANGHVSLVDALYDEDDNSTLQRLRVRRTVQTVAPLRPVPLKNCFVPLILTEEEEEDVAPELDCTTEKPADTLSSEEPRHLTENRSKTLGIDQQEKPEKSEVAQQDQTTAGSDTEEPVRLETNTAPVAGDEETRNEVNAFLTDVRLDQLEDAPVNKCIRSEEEDSSVANFASNAIEGYAIAGSCGKDIFIVKVGGRATVEESTEEMERTSKADFKITSTSQRTVSVLASGLDAFLASADFDGRVVLWRRRERG